MKRVLTFVMLAIVAVAMLTACANDNSQSEPDKIRIGWQTLWATQGQVVKSLQNTNILSMNGLEAEFVGVEYGPLLNPLALRGDLDVILTADQPAAMLLAKGGEWKIIGRLMYNSTRVYVQPDSPIETMADLKGGKVAGPIGAAAQRIALKGFVDAGLNPLTDIEETALQMSAQGPIVLGGGDWPVDAMYGFDPVGANFVYQGHARLIYAGNVVSLVLMSTDYLENHEEAARNFTRAFVEAWYFYSAHQDTANAWFKEESQIPFDTEVLDIAASVEPNIQAQSIQDIRPLLNDEDMEVLQEAADFIYEQGLTDVQLEIALFVDQSLMESVVEELSEGYDPGRVKVNSDK